MRRAETNKKVGTPGGSNDKRDPNQQRRESATGSGSGSRIATTTEAAMAAELLAGFAGATL